MNDTRHHDDHGLLVAVFAGPDRARAAVAEMRRAGRCSASLGVLSPRGAEGFVWFGGDETACRSRRTTSAIDGGLSFATGELRPIGPVFAAGFFVAALGSPEGALGDVHSALAPLDIFDEVAYFERALCSGRTIVAARGADLGRGSHIVGRHRARLGRLYRGVSDGIRGRTVVSAM